MGYILCSQMKYACVLQFSNKIDTVGENKVFLRRVAHSIKKNYLLRKFAPFFDAFSMNGRLTFP